MKIKKRAQSSQNEDFKQALLSSCNDLRTSVAAHHDGVRAVFSSRQDPAEVSQYIFSHDSSFFVEGPLGNRGVGGSG